MYKFVNLQAYSISTYHSLRKGSLIKISRKIKQALSCKELQLQAYCHWSNKSHESCNILVGWLAWRLNSLVIYGPGPSSFRRLNSLVIYGPGPAHSVTIPTGCFPGLWLPWQCKMYMSSFQVSQSLILRQCLQNGCIDTCMSFENYQDCTDLCGYYQLSLRTRAPQELGS